MDCMHDEFVAVHDAKLKQYIEQQSAHQSPQAHRPTKQHYNCSV